MVVAAYIKVSGYALSLVMPGADQAFGKFYANYSHLDSVDYFIGDDGSAIVCNNTRDEIIGFNLSNLEIVNIVNMKWLGMPLFMDFMHALIAADTL